MITTKITKFDKIWNEFQKFLKKNSPMLQEGFVASDSTHC